MKAAGKGVGVAFAIMMTIAVRGGVDLDRLVADMTIREKVGQLNYLALFPWNVSGMDGMVDSVKKGEVSGFIWGVPPNPVLRNEIQRAAVENSRLGIPLFFGRDNIHGAHLTFPIAPALAGAFEPELFKRVQEVSAMESRAEGVDWVFAPMCDTARDPRWGRVQETCGEDPYLNSLCSAAQVRGFQGDDPSLPNRVISCPKHFAGYSSVTGGRDYQDSEVSEWQLRNLHLPPFRAAIEEAGALTVMSAFNTYDGIPAVANRFLLTDVLRGEWGFKGFVASDWGSIHELLGWGIAADVREAAEMSLLAGNDLDLAGGVFISNLVAMVESGKVSPSALDCAVMRILRVKAAAGLFNRPYVDEMSMERVWRESRTANAALARECVRKSAVLLKNEGGVLPLDGKRLRRVALIGPFADDRVEMIGAWSGRGEPSTVVTLAAGLRTALPGVEMDVVKGCNASSKASTKTLEDGTVVAEDSGADADLFDVDRALAAAKEADVVVFTIGETKGVTGENQSRATLGATGLQQALFDAVASLDKPIVSLIFAGRPLALNEVYDRSAAVLYCWQPGSEAGNGLADLILGKESPSARLVISVPWSVGELPCFYNRPATGRARNLDGYYQDMPKRTSRFPFGYGLTYTAFEYSDVSVDGDSASATVKNVGRCEAIETVQLYIHQTACREGWRPIRELRGFRRLRLKPGESVRVSFSLTDDVLGYTRRDGKRICDRGEYRIWIARDSSVDGKDGVVYVR